MYNCIRQSNGWYLFTIGNVDFLSFGIEYIKYLSKKSILNKMFEWYTQFQICKEHVLNVILQLYILNKGLDFKDGVVVDF